VGRLAGISGKQAVKAFVRAGFSVARQKGSHITLEKKGVPSLVIPNHKSLSPFLLRSQVERAGLTEEQFLDLI
jgi:predicted RNA binding protein YcfA (HicA-like mRNA interferase family)